MLGYITEYIYDVFVEAIYDLAQDVHMNWNLWIVLVAIVAMSIAYIHSEYNPRGSEHVCTHWGLKSTLIPGMTIAHCDEWRQKDD